MGKLRKACANCIKYKLACEAKRPCARCVLHQCDCIDVERKPRTVKNKGIKRARLTPCADSATCSHDHDHSTPTAHMDSPQLEHKKSSSPMHGYPELALNDTDALFQTNNNTSDASFLLQSGDSFALSSEYGYMFNNSLLSAVLSPYSGYDAPHQAALQQAKPALTNEAFAFNTFVPKTELPFKQPHSPPVGINATSTFASMSPMSVMNPSNKVTLPYPQPFMVIEKRECKILDCNTEFAQFLGYSGVAEFNAKVNKLEDVLVTDESKPFDFTPVKMGHFERLATLKTLYGVGGRPVIFNVAVMQNLVTFTVKDVFDIGKPLCSYTRWLKTVMPNTPVLPCGPNCQCKYYDFLVGSNNSNQQQQQIGMSM
jgi:hypothetical protein